ncbi:metallophosphoesterase family protein [Maribacter sp. 2307UL18-2]|uniref:metallophosphoesterase family protein n=1 Tax=Maribacter sp. 2307UL18-2 TaxID=3386274 RepID=UPI0039BD779F
MIKEHENRRSFIRKFGLGTAAFAVSNSTLFAFAPKGNLEQKDSLKIGFITDIHHGLCTDALKRLEVFLKEASGRDLDFIIQGGDFCHPTEAGRECIDLWNSYKGAKYHVLGNHDMDKGTKEDTMSFWGMTDKYYSFDKGDFHFVILDGNYILKEGKYMDYAHGNFYIDQENRSLVHPDQIAWLREDLAATDRQSIIISHQAFDEIWDGWSSPSRFAVRKVIDDANNRSDFQKVIACFCGHHHLDDHSFINNVHYFQMNSASYYWAGEGYGSDGSMAIYKDSVFAFLTIDPSGHISIEGRESTFVSPTPMELEHPDAPRLAASIDNRTIKFNSK